MQTETVRPQLTLDLTNFSADPAASWDRLRLRAVAADAAGVDGIFASDHVLYGEDVEAYSKPSQGGVLRGRQPTGPDGHWLEPLTVLSYLAALTTRPRLLTAILQAALRRPIVLAKTAATLDVLSGGRLELGVGVGWQRAEYEAANLSFEGRGRQLDHTLEVCEALWQSSPASYSSPELSFEALYQNPKPLHPGGVPIWVSGTANPRVIRRLVRFGTGWIPWGSSDPDPGPGIELIRAAFAEGGRDPDTLRVLGRLVLQETPDSEPDLARTMATVEPMLEVGVTEFRLVYPVQDDLASEIESLRTLVAAFDAAAGRTQPQ